MDSILKLLNVLEHTPNSKKINQLIKIAESEYTVDIKEQINQLTGVWELKWSTSSSPFLNYSPLLDNLQILEPKRNRGINLLRPKGGFGKIFSAKIMASLDIIDHKRIDVSFINMGQFLSLILYFLFLVLYSYYYKELDKQNN